MIPQTVEKPFASLCNYPCHDQTTRSNALPASNTQFLDLKKRHLMQSLNLETCFLHTRMSSLLGTSAPRKASRHWKGVSCKLRAGKKGAALGPTPEASYTIHDALKAEGFVAAFEGLRLGSKLGAKGPGYASKELCKGKMLMVSTAGSGIFLVSGACE